MSDAVITVENLSKRYLIGHTSGERYIALRDVLGREARTLGIQRCKLGDQTR
jgi:lipopolysaccharide transport system ATP-binding protein